MRGALIALLLAAAAPLFVGAALRFATDPVALAAARPLLHRDGGFAGAEACGACHPDHAASWRATFHASMTQRPTAAVVRGAFDGRRVDCGEVVVRPFVRDGAFCMEVPATGGGTRVAEVALAVGSRRYQQYFERQRRGDTDALVRLPILWHIDAQRWLPLDTVFLEPDGERFEAHAAVWNENCIFCHNTAPAPRVVNYRDPARLRDGSRFDSRVADLGIGCEACHGPAAEHAAARRDPLARLGLRGELAATAAVLPPRLEQERAVSICGQCHGARLPQPLTRIADWLTTGPTFRAGARLREHVTPIAIDTPVYGKDSDPQTFAQRFWGDGTPRLTAYEYQGITASACYTRGGMTCGSCHAMHDGDPRGQLRPDRLGDAMCTQCHAAIGRDPTAHTHHANGSSGSRCVECHMPRIVYGVTELHRSHRIDSPDAGRDAASGRPHACTLCHADRSLAWAGERLRALWGDRFAVTVARRDGLPSIAPDGIASLHAGDAAARAVWAAALGRDGAAAAIAVDADLPLRAHLAVALGDGYPMVRWLAQRSLQANERRRPRGLADLLAGLDHTAGPEPRRRALFAALDALAVSARGAQPQPTMLLQADGRLDIAAVIRLTDRQQKNPISIGE